MGTNWQPSLDDGRLPKYQALVQALRRGIQNDDLKPGDKLPTVRALAWSLGVTPGTVARAYRQAVEEGILDAVVGRGTFVADPALTAYTPVPAVLPEAEEGDVDLRGCRTPMLGQEKTIQKILLELARAPNLAYVGHPRPRNDLNAREAVCGWVAENGIEAAPDDVVLSYGAQNSMIIGLQSVLKGPSPVILTDEMAFPGFRLAARHLRAEILGVEQDGEGPRPDRIARACRRHGVQVLLTTTGAHNPTTIGMSEARRHEIANLAREFDFQIVEDDAYGLRPADAPMLRTLCRERSWYASSLTKSVTGGLRFGYLICPPGRGEAARNIMCSQCYGMQQMTVDLGERFITSGAAAEFRRKVLAVTAERVRASINILGGWDVRWREDVPFLWLRLPQGWRASSFAMACQREGVLVRPADEFALADGRAPNAVRIAVNCNIPERVLERAMHTISGLLSRPPMIAEV